MAALRAAHDLSWANLPIIAIVALLVPFYMFSGVICQLCGFRRPKACLAQVTALLTCLA